MVEQLLQNGQSHAPQRVRNLHGALEVRQGVKPTHSQPPHRFIVLSHHLHQIIGILETHHATSLPVFAPLYPLHREIAVLDASLHQILQLQSISCCISEGSLQNFHLFDFAKLSENLLQEALVGEFVQFIDVKRLFIDFYFDLSSVQGGVIDEGLMGLHCCTFVSKPDEGFAVRLPNIPPELNILPFPGKLSFRPPHW